MPAPQVVQSLADALGGVDREAAYRKGMAERVDIDHTQAQTEAALQLARDRRLDAQRKEKEDAAREALREQLANLPPGSTDQTGFDPYNVMAGGFGDEYAGLQLGRTRAQEYNLKETIATPSMGMGLGDELDPAIAHEFNREAALEASAPASALATRRMDPSYEMVLQPDGTSIYVPSALAGGAPVGGRPSQAGGSAANAGGLSTAVQSLIYRQAAGLFGGTYDPLTGRFAGLDRESMEKVQRIASRGAVIMKGGTGVDALTAVDQALKEAQDAAAAGTEIPPQFGDDLAGGAVDEYEGLEAVNAQGQKVIWRNGAWVSAQ